MLDLLDTYTRYAKDYMAVASSSDPLKPLQTRLILGRKRIRYQTDARVKNMSWTGDDEFMDDLKEEIRHHHPHFLEGVADETQSCHTFASLLGFVNDSLSCVGGALRPTVGTRVID